MRAGRERQGRHVSVEHKASSTPLQHKVALPALNRSSCVVKDGNISENTKQTVLSTSFKTTLIYLKTKDTENDKV